ncbi:MAG: hypothetical protein JWP58_2689 [Hymenobacter sp.]|nr:hypothetical protein [Hymenobacter sp.]
MQAPRTPAAPAKATAAPTLRPAQPLLQPTLRPAQPFLQPARRPVAATPAARAQPVRPAPAGHSDLDWLPTFVQEKASAYAHGLAGYPLLTVLLAHDPFTGQRVARTPQALAEGLLALSPDGQQLLRTVRESGVLPAVAELIEQHAAAHHLSQARVRAVLAQSAQGFHSLSAWHPADALRLVVNPFERLALDAFHFAQAVVPPLLELVFARVAGPRAPQVLALLRRTGQTLRVIMQHPVRFLGYLVEAAKRGFLGFVHKADTYLKDGMAQWILGPLAQLNLTLPKHFDAAGILSLSLQVLGLTYPNLRQKMVHKVGETAVAALEKGAGLVQTLATQGPRAAGQELLALAGDLVAQVRQQVEDGVRSWLARTLLGRLVTELLKLLTPAGAVLTALEKTYTTVLFFLDKARQFQQLLATLVNALAPIAAGKIDAAATKVEQVLAGFVPLALGFVADFIGLGGLPAAVRAQLTQVRTLVNALIDRLLDKVLQLVGKLAKAGPQVATDAVGTVKGWLGLRQKFALSNGEKHTLFFRGAPGQAQLMMASEEMLVLRYLDRRQAYVREQNPPDKDKQLQHSAAARLLAEDLEQRILTTTPQLHQDGPAVAVKVQELGIAMGLVGGLTDEAHLPLPTTAISNYDRLQSATMKSSDLTLISSSSASKTNGLGNQSPNGWALLKEAGFTRNTSPEIWVRMHLVSQKLSGEPTDANLVPAPSRQNTGEVLTFETLVKKLAGVGPGKKKSITRQPSVLWLYTTATFHDSAKEQEILAPYKGAIPDDAKQPYFARQVLFEAGIHYYVPNPDPAKAWVRDPTAYFRLTATISAPKLDPDHVWVPNLNDIGEAVIADRSNCSTRFARMVKRVQKAGNYQRPDDVEARLIKARYHPDHKADVSSFDTDLELLMAALTDTQTIMTDRPPTKGKKQRVKAPMGRLEAHDKKK